MMLQIDFIFFIDIALDLPKQLQCFLDKTLSCLDNVYLEVATQSSSMKKAFLKSFATFGEHLCWSPFLIKWEAGSIKLS